MSASLYNNDILRLAASIPHHQRLADPQASVEKRSPTCGSRITADVRMADGRLAEMGLDVKACALGQATAGVLGQHVVGASLSEIADARDAMIAMLKSGGEGPSGRFEDLRLLKQVADYPARHASTLVSLEATLEAVNAALTARTRLAGAA